MFKYPSDSEPEITVNLCAAEFAETAILDASGHGSGAGFTEEILKKSANAELRIRNHHGTHIDAPAHKLLYGKKISEYPIEKFVNNARLIDLTVTDLLKRERREITLEDIKSHLIFADFGTIREYIGKSTALVFYTGFCDELSANEGRLMNDEKTKFEKTFPYFNEGTAELVAIPGMNIIGIDSFAVDPAGSKGEVHKIFFAKDILPLETLVNLKNLRNVVRENNFCLHSVPENYFGLDAAQTRAYAEVKNE